MAMAPPATSSPPTFQLYGRSPHLRLANAADLACAAELDEAHWVATSAAVESFNCDPALLHWLDSDRNGRIVCHDLKSAMRWLLATLRDHTGIAEHSQSLCLDAINTQTADGRSIHSAASKILVRLGSPAAASVSLAQVRQVKAQIDANPVSEAGVILPAAAADPVIAQFMADILATVGGAPHPSGGQGVTTAALTSFLSTAAAYRAWDEQGQHAAETERSTLLPLGAATPAAFQLFASIRPKLDQFFAQCEAAALDERFVTRMGCTEAEIQALDFDDPGVIADLLAKAPLTKANPERILTLDMPLNPFYAEPLTRFFAQVLHELQPDCGRSLTSRQWQLLKTSLAPYEAWRQAQPDPRFATLAPERLLSYLDPSYAAAVRALIADSSQTALILDNIRLVEKLILYQAMLLDFANNFTSFPHLYDPASSAMFEMGRLVMDGRRFNFSIRVSNHAQHLAVARTSSMFVLYVALTAKTGGPDLEVCVPVTYGGKGNLCPGKRGVFYDLAGTEYDARVLEIIENPISFAEALSAPFLRIGKLLTGKIESLTSESTSKLETQTSLALNQVSQAVPGATAAPLQPAASRLNAGGMVMGAGVAVAALSSAFAYVAKTLSETSWVSLLTGIGGALLLVMLPSSVVAFLKLRRRDMSAILEGASWAINARMQLTHAQSRYFTTHPPYPSHARGIRRRLWRRLLLAALLGLLFAAAFYLIGRWHAG